ncbi:mandelate racemase/muconate lactonizing enzyme family protein [Brevibacillus sp. NRS-1366]|uniref:mandelate racemase/muconate lactonizing enzyme family protein n=1 Tax=Brevibacillus sp. NRS-1366 TaxID=3233899 RepID=UPI003D1E2B91
MIITDVRVTRYREMSAPDSRHAAGKEVQVVDVLTDAGVSGRGFLSIVVSEASSNGDISANLLRRDLKASVLGENPLYHDKAWQRMYDQVAARLGRRGIVRQCMAAIDFALWDLKGKLFGVPVTALLGNHRERIPTYANLGQQLPHDQLAQKAAEYVNKGHSAVKIRVGRSAVTLKEATMRVAAVREAIGIDAKLMVDANGTWDAETAIGQLRAWDRYDLYWLEEPVPPEDLAGYIRVRKHAGRTFIAGGEQHAGLLECSQLIEKGAIDILQPNALATGGITDWLKIYHFALASGIIVSPWNLQQIHSHLGAGLAGVKWIEYFTEDRNDLTNRLFKGPGMREIRESDGIYLLAPEGPGLGLVLDEKVAESTIVAE